MNKQHLAKEERKADVSFIGLYLFGLLFWLGVELLTLNIFPRFGLVSLCLLVLYTPFFLFAVALCKVAK